uniref:RNA-directed DNA polymerase n=1 Tax=Tanacetum cinerariifolium TaxID=118510 RepID=A0A6L2KN82_TANCI|nr:reverse transcriptase domain-containing protein [Tanacetum cinerariifolium]
MLTRSQSRNNFPQQEASPAIVEPLRIENPFLEDQFQEDPPNDPPEVPMADDRTMVELLQAPPRQRFDELFNEAWDRFNNLLRACPHHGFFELHQLDTFYNALNINDQDSLNSATGGNFLDKMPRECLKIIESKSKVRQTRAKAVVAKVSMSSSTPAISSDVAELKDMVRALLLDKENQSSALTQSPTPASVKAVEPNCITCGGTHSYQNCPATSENVYRDNIQEYVSQAAAANFNQGNTGFRPQMVANQIRPPAFPFHQNNQNNFNRGNNFNQNRGESGILLSNTVTNPKEDLKGITTRSGVAYQGPTIPTLSKQGTELLPLVSMPNLKPSISYPSRRNNERRRDQANEQIEKFYEIFKDMSFEISFTDALILMPKFASTLKALIGNKEKLSEMARTPMNEHCSAVILNKLPRKLGDPSKFLIPCEFPGMDECLALADLGANINLMPLSVWEGLSLLELTPTCMTLELADCSVSKPIGIARDVSVKVGVFHFPADFVVVDFEPDHRVLLILERCFLMTGRALIDVHKGELTLRIKNESITYNLDQPSRDSDFLLFEEADTFLGLEDDLNSPEFNPFYYDPEGDILLLEDILNSEPLPPLPNHEQYFPSFKKELKDLPPHLEYAILEGENKLPVIIARELGDEEKTALIKRTTNQQYNIIDELIPRPMTSLKKRLKKLLDAGLIYPISDSLWVSPVHCVPKKGGFTIIENEENELIPTRLVIGWRTMEVFMDDFSVFRNSFENCPSRLDKMLQRCEDTNLSLNLQKSHFMVKEGIVLGHKISKNGIKVDRAKVNVIAKLPHPITVKGIRSFLGHVSFYRQFIQDFSKISRPMTHLLEKNTPFIFSKYCIKAFQTLKKKLTEAPILIAPHWDLPFELMCDASDFAIGAVLGKRHEKHFKHIHYASKTMKDAESNYTMTEKEMLAVVYAFEKFRSYLIMNKSIVHTDHSAIKCLFAKKDTKARLLRWVLLLQEFDFKVLDTKGAENLAADHLSRLENPFENVLDPKEINGKFPLETLSMVTFCGDSSASWFVDFANFHAGNFIVKGNKYILVAVDYLSKWVEAKVLPTNDFRVVCKFLKSLFARFGAPRAIISNRGTHFCNDQFAKVMLKYGVTHRLSTAYHPQTSGQVEVSNRGLKRILERTIGENRASWSDKLDDALWAFRIAYKIPIGCTPYKLVYEKACHLPIELKQKSYWALKQANFDLAIAGDHQKVQLNELNELRDHAYENSLIYKEKTKRIHDFKIKNRVFNVGDRVLLFNSRLKILSGKLKTRWSRPFTIAKVFTYGTVELS